MVLPITQNSPSVRRWSYTAEADEVSVVLPDGCIDILVVSHNKSETAKVYVTDLDASPRRVALRAGTRFTGYRLRPGSKVGLTQGDIEGLGHWNLAAEIASNIVHNREVEGIIDALCVPDSSVDRVAKQQGVSERTLQRHFKKLSLPKPVFWRQLGRARRAVQALPCRAPLSEIALEYGYSDQAHMTRECVRWFGRTPAQLRQEPHVISDLAQPGLGNWLGETRLEPAGLT